MTTSGVFLTEPPVVTIVADALDRIQIRAASITTDHLISARRSLSFVFSRLDNLGVNLWAVDLQTVAMTADTIMYNCPASTVEVLDVYRHDVTTGIDIILGPLSRTDYASIPSKDQSGTPTSYWLNRQTPIPVIYVWQPASQDGQYELRYWRWRQLQEANPQGQETTDIPIRFYEAVCSGLAAHMAMKWKPEAAQALMAYAKETWTDAAAEDRERVPLRIIPSASDYFW